MKYVALLRGINVGGNNIIKMEQFKACFEAGGFEQVMTYIQSGNVLFASDEEDKAKLTSAIEAMVSQTFHYSARIVIRSYPEMQRVVSEVPNDWKYRTDLRCNIAFIKEPVKATEIKAALRVSLLLHCVLSFAKGWHNSCEQLE